MKKKNKRIICVIALIIVLIITFSFYKMYFGYNTSVNKSYDNEYGGETITIASFGGKVNGFFYDTSEVPFIDKSAPLVYKEEKDKEGKVRHYSYHKTVDLSIKELIDYYSDYYEIEEGEIFLEDDSSYESFNFERGKFTIFISLRNDGKRTTVTFGKQRYK